MDTFEATKIVFSRIQTLDPENASKIMGYIFIHDPGEKQMIRLALGPESLLLSLISQAKTHLGISSNTSSTPSSPSPFSSISNPNRPNSFPQSSPRIIIPNNGFHLNPNSPSSPWSVSGFSDHRLSPRPSSSLSYAAVVNGNSNRASGSFSPPFYGNNSNDEYSVQDLDFVDPIVSPSGRSDSILFENRHHRRTLSDVFPGGDWCEDGGVGSGWRPCMYFAKGFCKNGNNCKFLHDGFGDSGGDASSAAAVVGSPSKFDGFDELLRMKTIQQQRFAAASQVMAGGPFPYTKCMNFNDSPRSVAATLWMGDEFNKFGRYRPERNDFLAMGLGGNTNSSTSRQIYLTFPADSTFKEEDVSNYFSKFGPVQDVRIPFQQKRMFGFVTFVYPETVKMILAKGNPHFVCDSRVLVKPYKEKGKVPDRKHNQLERGDFSACLSPSGLDSGESYDLPIGARMFYNSPEMMLRRKLEEEAELQQAIELQGRRMMNLQLMDLKNHHHSRQFQTSMAPSVPIPFPSQPDLHIDHNLVLQSDGVNQEVSEVAAENNISPTAANSPTFSADEQQQQEVRKACDKSNGLDGGNCKEQCSNPHDDLQESLEHILPDNLFASPTKSAGDHRSIFSATSAGADDSAALVTSTSSANNNPMLPNSSTLGMTSKSCYFQMPSH